MATATKKKTKTILEAEQMTGLLAGVSEYVVLDIETTGLAPSKGGRIIEIAGIRVKDGKLVQKFSEFIHPEAKIYGKTIELTGITNEMLEGKRTYREVLPDFHKFIGNHLVVAHNSIFDWDRFLVHYFEKCGIQVQNEVVDTLKLAKLFHPELSSYKLADVCAFYDVTLENAHRAINDTIATAKMVVKMKEKHVDSSSYGGNIFASVMDSPPQPSIKNKFSIKGISYWEKALTKKKKYQRIYVNIGIGSVYFDIPSKTWYNKDVKENICFESLEQHVIKTLNLKNQVDLCFYRN